MSDTERLAKDGKCHTLGHQAKPLGGDYWRCWICDAGWDERPDDKDCAPGFKVK